MSGQYQIPLFTARGNPHSMEREAADLRVALLEHLGKLYGAVPIPVDEYPCPECGGELTVVLHPSCQMAYCICGFKIDIDGDE